MFWNVTSALYEVLLRKWFGGTAQLRTLEGALVAKNALCWRQCFTHSRHQRRI